MFDKYLIDTAITKQEQRPESVAIRRDYPSYHSLMISEKGSVFKLLGTSIKTDKQVDGRNVVIRPLYLAPHRQAGWEWESRDRYAQPVLDEHGKPKMRYPTLNMCPFAGACADSCLSTSGNRRFHTRYAVDKTRAFVAYPRQFLIEIVKDISRWAHHAHVDGQLLYVRLDGTSDNRWERFIDMAAMVRDFAGLGGFYDYTKFPLGLRKQSPVHHLTYSIDENDASLRRAAEYKAAGYPFAVVVDHNDKKKLMKLEGVQITDGDKSDQRWFDTGLVVLKAKGITGKYREKGKGLIRTFGQVLELL